MQCDRLAREKSISERVLLNVILDLDADKHMRTLVYDLNESDLHSLLYEDTLDLIWLADWAADSSSYWSPNLIYASVSVLSI